MMKKKEVQSVAPSIGGTSLLVIFSVICLAVFAVLSLTTAQAEKRLSDKAAEAAAAYYRADSTAEEIFAQLRKDESHEDAIWEGNVCTYQVAISDHQLLEVRLRNDADGWTVLRWQTRSHVDTNNTNSLPVWDGSSLQEVSP